MAVVKITMGGCFRVFEKSMLKAWACGYPGKSTPQSPLDAMVMRVLRAMITHDILGQSRLADNSTSGWHR